MLKLSLTVDEIDYNALIDKLLPILKSSMAGSSDPKLQMAAKLPMPMAAAALKSLSEVQKEQLTAALLNNYKDGLAVQLSKYASEQGVPLTVQIDEIKNER